MDDYQSMETSYPGPPSYASPHPRAAFSLPPEGRLEGGRFKVIDDLAEPAPVATAYGGGHGGGGRRGLDPASGMQGRNQIPNYHTTPRPDGGHTVHPFNHAMKRVGNADKMREIFGDHQSFAGMDTIDFSKGINKREEFGVNPMVMFPPASAGPPASAPRSPDEWATSGAHSPVEQNLPRMRIIDPAYEDPREGGVREGYASASSASAFSASYPARSSQQPAQPPTRERKKIYDAILEYFPGFTMTKTASHGSFAVYKAVAKCMLCDGVRYVIAIVKGEPPGVQLGTKVPLSMLAWTNFQTRYSDDDRDVKKFNLSSHAYGRPDQTILDDTIRMTRGNKTSLYYACDNLPVEVEIIKLKEDEHIAESGTLASALELWQTSISFLG